MDIWRKSGELSANPTGERVFGNGTGLENDGNSSQRPSEGPKNEKFIVNLHFSKASESS